MSSHKKTGGYRLHYYKQLLIMQTPPLLVRSVSTVMIFFVLLLVGLIIKVNYFLERYIFDILHVEKIKLFFRRHLVTLI